MDIIALKAKANEIKAKAKETKDNAVGFLRRNKKDIIILSVLTAVAAWGQSLDDSDERNEINGAEYGGNFVSNPPYGLDEGSANQTCLPRNHPQRDIAGIDVTGSSLMGYEKQFLENLSTQYDRFKGKEQTIERNDVGISSDGKYTSQTKIKYSFPEDKIGINVQMIYKDDDGRREESTSTIDKGRDLINFAKDNKNLRMFNDVQDIVDMYPKTNNET